MTVHPRLLNSFTLLPLPSPFVLWMSSFASCNGLELDYLLISRLGQDALLLQFASFLTFLPADHDTLDDYGTALTHGILPGIPF